MKKGELFDFGEERVVVRGKEGIKHMTKIFVSGGKERGRR